MSVEAQARAHCRRWNLTATDATVTAMAGFVSRRTEGDYVPPAREYPWLYHEAWRATGGFGGRSGGRTGEQSDDRQR